MSEPRHHHKYPPPPSAEELGLDPGTAGRLSGDQLPKMKKFRFQLLADWIVSRYPPCRVADVGGGKGMVAHLLRQRGFDAVVVDPVEQSLPTKFTDLRQGRRLRIPTDVGVPRISQPFTSDLGRRFDLLVALHSHGSNMEIIEACAHHGAVGIMLPCCVIDEPTAPPPGEHWFGWLARQARERGLGTEFLRLNFRGQNLGMVMSRPAADRW